MGAAVALAQRDGDLGHRGLAEGEEHLGTMVDDAVVLLAGAGQEAGHVDEGHQRDVEGVAEAHEAGALARSVAVEHAGHGLGLVGDDTHAGAAHVGEADHEVLGKVFMHFEELAVVDDGVDDIFHIVSLVGILGNDAVQAILQTVDGVAGRYEGGLLEVVAGDISNQLSDELQGALLGLTHEVGHAALGGMHHGAAELVDGDILARDGLDHLRAGEEHIAVLLRHQDKVGQGRAVDRAAGAGAEDGANLGHHTAGQDVALENLGVAGQGVDTLLDTGSARVVETDDGGADLHGLVHHLADFQCHRLAQRAAEDGEVLGEHIDHAAVDGAVARHHAVAQERLLLHVEVLATVCDKHVEFFKRALVEQQGDTLAGRQFALVVLLVDTFLAATHTGFATFVEQLFYLLFKSHFVDFLGSER